MGDTFGRELERVFMQGSLIICTKNRARQLKRCLEYVHAALKPEQLVEIVIVDNDSNDETKFVVEEHQNKSTFTTKYIKCEKAGLGSARNFGIRGSVGEWLIFTDDDCYIEQEFFINFFRSITEINFSPSSEHVILYGSGQILPFDTEDDSRVSALTIEKLAIIPPFTVVRPGTVQGANMFFHRSIFQKIGVFNEHMGAGTPFPCEDIEMAARAALAGYFGAQVPDFKVLHHHKRKSRSLAAVSLIEGYDYGRGAYYANLLAQGRLQAWYFWGESIKESHFDSVSRLKLARELYGASKYLECEWEELEKPRQRQIRDLKTSVRALTEERDHLQSQATMLAEECGSLRTHSELLAAERNGLSGRLTTLSEERATLKAHAEALATERDSLKAHAEALATERDSLKEMLAERDAQITALNQAVAAWNGELAVLKGTIAERDVQITALDQAVGLRNGEIAALRCSTSWRITAPLRGAVRFLRHRKDPK